MTHREISRTLVMGFVTPLLARGTKRLPRLLLTPLCLCALVLAASLLTPPAQTRAQSCASCAQNENLARVGFTGSVCSTQGFTVSLNGVARSGAGNCTADTWVTTPKAYTELQVDQTYQLTVGTGSCSTHVVFDVPEKYRLEINGVETNTIDVGGSAKGSGDGSWSIVVRKCEECESTQCGDSCEVQIGSVDWSASLGSLSDGRWAQAISIRQDFITPSIYTPSALVYSPPGQTGEVDVVRNQDGSLRQIRATQGFADIVVISGQEYDIRFYSPASVGAKAGGLYPLSGEPYLTWKIKNPDPSTTSRVQISRTQNGVTETYEYAWDAVSDTWTLAEGGGDRVTTKLVAFVSADTRVETTVVRDAAGRVASKVALTFHSFPWGEELLTEVRDPDGAALTTSYAYYEDAAEAGRYTKLKSVSFPDGSWEKYDYNGTGKKSLVLRPWKDTTLDAATEANSYAVYYRYSNFDGVRVSLYADLISGVEEKIAGVMVRKTTYTRTGLTLNEEPAVAEARTEYASASLTQTTTTTTYHSSASAFLANRVASVLSPDGTLESYSYEKGNFVADADPSLSRFTPDAGGAAERTSVVRGTASAPNGVAFKSTKDVSVRDGYGRVVLRETYVFDGAAYERTAWTALDYDGRGHLIQTRSSDGRASTATWSGDLKTAAVDESGVETVYTYDALKRVKTQTKKGVAAAGAFPAQADIVTTFSYDAEGRQREQTVAGGGLSISKWNAYDAAGRLRREADAADRLKGETDEAALVTTYAYADGGRTETVTTPGGATRVSDKFLDGQPKSTTGAAVVAQYFDYGVNADGTRYSHVFTGGPSSPRWVKTTTDWLGRMIKTERPGFTGAALVQTYAYNDKGQLQSESMLSGGVKLLADKLYEYDALGIQTRVGSDLDASGTLAPASTDRVDETEVVYEKSGGDWFRVTNSKTYLVNNSDEPTVSTRRQRLTGFAAVAAGQVVSEETAADVAGNVTRRTTSVNRAARKVTVTTDAPDSDIDAVSVSVNGLLQSSSPRTPESATTYAYDALGRQTGVTDPRAGTVTKSYSATTGQLLSAGDAAQTTVYEYYPAPHASAGRLKSQTNAAGKRVYFNYSGRGELTQTWGDTAYPLEYVYDAYGQPTELHTFRGGQNWGGGAWPGSLAGAADVTRWVYQESTGLLTQKHDAAGKQVVYAYDVLGRLGSRTWARAAAGGGALTTTYSYDPQTGALSGMDYSDATPDVTYGHDRGGRQSTITDAAGAHTRTFNAQGDLQTYQISGGILDSVQVSVTHDQYLRRQFLQSSLSATVMTGQSYTYDAASRMETVTAGGQTATYAYYPASGLLNTTTFSSGAQVSRGYDSLGRLQTIAAASPAGVAAAYTYTYNNLHQRTKVTREDGSYWAYSYNDRGELTSGRKYWADGAPVWGAQTEYSFDSVGNRTASRSGGNQLGQLRQSGYTANALNQYAQRTNPGAIDIAGAANSAAAVSVNDQPAARRGDYFYKELSADNAAGAVSAQVSVVGARQNFGAGGEDAVTQQGGKVFVPQAAESYAYDADGNLTRDGRWQYEWDAENRLVVMQANADAPADAKLRLEFSYDGMGRRIRKKVYAWNAATGSYQLQSAARFVYDGWNLIAELGAGGALVRGYVWGQDVSGTPQGAGGVGGLLLVREGAGVYAVGYDGGGNVTSLLDAATNAVAASYDYDAFGNTLKAVGPYSGANPFRFSTKYADAETGLLYYGYRYYQPQTGGWISRDPIEESGGVNLYGFVANRPTGAVDVLGAKSFSDHAYDKMMDLFLHHDHEVGSKFPGNKAGRSDTNCIIYVRNVLEYAYQKIGRRDIADIVHRLPKEGGMALAKFLTSQGWRAHYWNPDVRNPRDGEAHHPITYRDAVNTRKYYEVDVSGFIVNYNLQDKTVRKEWIFPPAIALPAPGPGILLPFPQRIEVGGDNLGTFNRFKGVKFAYGLARGAMHTFLYSYGDIYEVHWKLEKDQLYERSPFYSYEWNSGLMLTPPDSDFTSQDIKAPRR